MKAGRTRIVCYAVNGSGVGHLVRLVAITRWLRRYALWVGAPLEITFLSSSEADTLLFRERIPCFKLPSKTAAQEGALEKTAYLGLAKQWIWHSLGLLRPDLFVVDTFPSGSFGELPSALDLCKRRALILRPMKPEFGNLREVTAPLPLYDTIVVPAHEDEADVPLTDAVRARTRWVGPIAIRERVELRDRAEARLRLGLSDEANVVLVSAGGGGDPIAEAQLLESIEALRGRGLELVIAPGPLYRGDVVRRDGVHWLAHENVAELMRAFDVAVTAAGFNTFSELMHAGVPTVFLPQPKIADDQHGRAATAARAGAALVIGSSSELAGAVTELLARREDASARAAALVPKNGARLAAAELLRTVLPDREVDDAEDAITDAALELGHARPGGLAGAIDLMRALAPADARPGDALVRATRAVADDLTARGMRPDDQPRFVGAIARRLPNVPLADRGRAVLDVADVLAPFDDWVGATSVVKTFPAAGDLLAQVSTFAGELTRDRLSLVEGLARAARSA